MTNTHAMQFLKILRTVSALVVGGLGTRRGTELLVHWWWWSGDKEKDRTVSALVVVVWGQGEGQNC